MKKSIRALALLLALTASGEPFEFMIAATRQDASLDWWYAVPSAFAPKVTGVSHVAKGEYFNIIPIFKNYATDTNGHAKITYDFEVLRPDGSTDESLKNCAGHQGEATPIHLLAARAVVRLSFDPEDPYGEYTIHITAYDHVSNQTNRQSTTIEQRAWVLKTLTEEEQEALFLRYPTYPDPSRALAVFLQNKQSFFEEGHEPLWSAIWFFKTIFENNEFLMPPLLEAFATGTPKQKKDIILVLALMNQTDALPILPTPLNEFKQMMQAGRIPNPYAEITTGKQLDMLWAEYFATGRVKPVRQILSSLALSKHIGTLDRIKAGELDIEEEEVYRVAMLEAVFQSALWSLQSNAERSPLLFHYCVGIFDAETLAEAQQHTLGLLLQLISKNQPEVP